jgi:hypothetical protein
LRAKLCSAGGRSVSMSSGGMNKGMNKGVRNRFLTRGRHFGSLLAWEDQDGPLTGAGVSRPQPRQCADDDLREARGLRSAPADSGRGGAAYANAALGVLRALQSLASGRLAQRGRRIVATWAGYP